MSSNKEEIEVLNKGPIYICTECHAMLKVPLKYITEEDIEEEDEDGKYTVVLGYFDCPVCGNESSAYEHHLEEEPEKPRSKPEEKHEKKEKKSRK